MYYYVETAISARLKSSHLEKNYKSLSMKTSVGLIVLKITLYFIIAC